MIEETEETESILDNTDPGAFEGTGEIVEENDTMQSVQEQSEQKESEDLGIPEASDDGTMTEATEQTETPEETEAVSGDGMDASETEIPSDAGVVVPETELQPGDGAVIPETEVQQSEEADAAQTEAVLTEDDLKEEDKATYKEAKTALDEMFQTKELTFDDGTVVYLTENAAKAVPEALDEYLLNLLVRGEDSVAAEEEADPEINKNIVQETSELAPDKNYEDEQLKQADKFVRRLVFTDSEKLLEESQLENADKTLIYDKVMGILEKAYAPKDEAENAMTETPADGVTDEMIQDTGAVGDGTHMDQMEVPVDEFDGFEEETATF